jgi:NAD(P)-dependent dehydrogenase (short-subunit alcohol dehydrogenase family)
MNKETFMKTALVTGGNRGIGLEICKGLAGMGLRVILAARSEESANQAVAEIGGRNLETAVLDVADPDSISACVQDLEARGLSVDVLVNNAGVYPAGGLLEMDDSVMASALDVNLWGPLRLCRALVPAMIERGYGRVVNLSSGYGSFASGLGGPPAYSITKAALNAFTVKLNQETPDSVKVNAVCPGWVRTRMGGDNADRAPEEGAETPIWLATLPDDGPTGGFFRDKRRIDW